MQIRILIPLAASVLLVGCSSLGGAGGSGAGMIDCPPDADAADGYVGNPATKIVRNPGKELLHGPGWSADMAFHECEGVSMEKEAEAEPAPEPEPEVVPTPVEVNVPVKLDARALFQTDSADLGDSGRAALDSLAAGIEGLNQVRRVVVVGHTDSTGTDAYNQDLSERRAKSVADYLTTKLVGLDIASVGRGETKPVASNDTALGRAKNRRVEVVVIGSKTEMQK